MFVIEAVDSSKKYEQIYSNIEKILQIYFSILLYVSFCCKTLIFGFIEFSDFVTVGSIPGQIVFY